MTFTTDKCPTCGGEPRAIIEVVETKVSIMRDPNGKVFDYTGDSDVIWDTQTQLRENGKVTLICSGCGEHWTTEMQEEP